MSNQLNNEFVLSVNPQIAFNDGIGLVSPQILHSQANSSADLWPEFGNNATDDNYGLIVNDNQQVSFSVENLDHIQGQNMSQTAQIVLLPSQNINLVANVPKQEQVQMILPNDMGYQLLSSIPNVNVLVPTNILLTNGYILIDNTQSTSPNLSLESPESSHSSETLVAPNSNPLYLKQWIDTDQSSQPQMIATNLEFEDTQSQHLAQAQECEFIALADTGTQTVLSALPEAELSQTAHLISNNGQIVGIIGSEQLSILQSETVPENQVLIASCIDPNENMNLASQVESVSNYDINSILASTISTLTVEKTDQNEAKQWLKDSYIVNRALKALKKTNTGSHHHHNNSTRVHSQARR